MKVTKAWQPACGLVKTSSLSQRCIQQQNIVIHRHWREINWMYFFYTAHNSHLRAIWSSVSNMSKERNVSSSVFDNRMSRGVGPARLMADVMPHVVWPLPLSTAPPPLHTMHTNYMHKSQKLSKIKCLHIFGHRIIQIMKQRLYSVGHKKGANLVLSATLAKINRF